MADLNFLRKMFVKRFRFIFSFLCGKNSHALQFQNSKFIYSLLPDTVIFSSPGVCRITRSLNSLQYVYYGLKENLKH
jgi:hypothetical protein